MKLTQKQLNTARRQWHNKYDSKSRKISFKEYRQRYEHRLEYQRQYQRQYRADVKAFKSYKEEADASGRGAKGRNFKTFEDFRKYNIGSAVDAREALSRFHNVLPDKHMSESEYKSLLDTVSAFIDKHGAITEEELKAILQNEAQEQQEAEEGLIKSEDYAKSAKFELDEMF